MSMAKFTSQEVTSLQNGGNEVKIHRFPFIIDGLQFNNFVFVN